MTPYKPYKPKTHPRADDIAAAQPPIRHIVGPRPKVDKKKKRKDDKG